MSFTVVIPARFASTRLPGKPLADIAGKPMLQHVWERSRQSAAAQVLIATDDPRVESAARDFGADVIMTRADHVSGTDRVHEVVQQLGLMDEAVVVGVQGDEPLIPPAVIDQVAENLASSQRAGIATLCERIQDAATVFDPNAVKVVFAKDGHALYFSRAPIPWARDEFANPDLPPPSSQWWRHIGIYAYRAGFLKDFVQWPQGSLEQLEKLEQLRAMENGVAIHVAEACAPIPGGVDTREDLERVRRLLAEPSS